MVRSGRRGAGSLQDIKSRLAKASLWISATRWLAAVLTFVSLLVVARLLVPEDFGLVALASSLLLTLSAFTEISMASALVHLKEPTDDHYHTGWTMNVIRGVLVALLFCAIAPPVADLYDEPRLAGVMYVLSLSVVLTGLANPRLIMLQKKLIFRQLFYVTLSQNVVTVVVSIVLALIYRSYWALAFGTVAGQLANVVVSYALLPFRPRFGFRHARDLWSFSIWLAMGQVVNTVNFRFDHLLIGGYLGRTELGHYSVGSRIAIAPTREAVQPLAQSLFPAFSLLTDDVDRLRRGYQRAQATITSIALPAGIAFALVADPLVRLTMGEIWAPAIPVIQVIACLYAVQTLGSQAKPLAMATGATRLLFNRSLQMFLLRLPLVAAGMYFWGLPGVLAGRALSGTIGTIINMFMVRTLVGLKLGEQVAVNLRCFGGTAAMVAAMAAVQAALPPPEGMIELAAAVALPVLAAVPAYLAARWLLWRLAGRPRGHETEALETARRLVAGRRGGGEPADVQP